MSFREPKLDGCSFLNVSSGMTGNFRESMSQLHVPDLKPNLLALS